MNDKSIDTQYEYDEDFIKWARTPIDIKEYRNLGLGVNTPVKTYDELLKEHPISNDENKKNEQELLKLFNSFDKE